MRKRFVLFVVLPIFGLWLTVPFMCFAQEGPEIIAEKAEVPAPLKGKADWKGKIPTPSAEQMRQMEECLDRTHLYPVERARKDREPALKVSPLVNDPSSVWDPRIKAPGDFSFRVIHELTPSEAGPYRSNVMEPTVAVKGKNVLMTGNWFAARTTTEGTFTYLNPWGDWPLYPPRTGYKYCCDQEVVFDPLTQHFFWGILYVSKTNTGGYVRIAVSSNLRDWWAYDFDFEADGANDITLPDFPHLALSRNFLYLTYNEFAPGFTGTYLHRLPIGPMTRGERFIYNYFHTDDVFTLKVASDLKHHSTIYAVSNWAPNFPSIRVYEWKEDSNSLTYHDITRLNWWNWYGYLCTDPGGDNPCGRLDDRVLGAVSSYNSLFPDDCINQLWVAWTAAQDQTYSYPYIYMVKVCLNDWSVIGYAHVWNPYFSFAYPAIAANYRGDIGMTGDILGGSYYNMFWATAIDEYMGYYPGYTVYPVATGNQGPADDKWGDYNSVSHWYLNMYQWVGAGHVRYSGTKASTPYYVRFSRERDFEPVVNPCEGDFDNDGDVDGSDLAIFAADFGRTNCP